MKLTISNSTNKNKRLKAVFIDGDKKITRHFGFKGGSTYIDHRIKRNEKIIEKDTNQQKRNFIKIQQDQAHFQDLFCGVKQQI